MAIEKDVQEEVLGASRVDALMTNMNRGRIALGAAALVFPALSAKLMGLGNGKDGGRDVIARMFGVREIVLGAGYLLSKDRDRRAWARFGVVVDALDAVTGTKARKAGVPLWAAAGLTAFATGATAIGAAKVAQDGIR